MSENSGFVHYTFQVVPGVPGPFEQEVCWDYDGLGEPTETSLVRAIRELSERSGRVVDSAVFYEFGGCNEGGGPLNPDQGLKRMLAVNCSSEQPLVASWLRHPNHSSAENREAMFAAVWAIGFTQEMVEDYCSSLRQESRPELKRLYCNWVGSKLRRANLECA